MTDCGSCHNVKYAISCEYAFEWDTKCIDELKLVVGGPEHIFKDVGGAVPSNIRASCGLDGHLMPDLAEVSRVLRTMPIKTLLPCVKCTGDCGIIPSDMHRVSTPCQPHSMWRARTGFSDDRCKYALVWCRICSSLMYKVVISECVPGFGMKMFEDMLGSLFIMQRFLTCPRQLGWKILRPRQFVVMLSIPWVKQIVFEWLHPGAIDGLWTFLNMEGWMGFLFNATADYSYMEYLIGTEDELAEEVRIDLACEPGTLIRHQQR